MSPNKMLPRSALSGPLTPGSTIDLGNGAVALALPFDATRGASTYDQSITLSDLRAILVDPTVTHAVIAPQSGQTPVEDDMSDGLYFSPLPITAASSWPAISEAACSAALDGRLFVIPNLHPSNGSLNMASELVAEGDIIRAPYREFVILSRASLSSAFDDDAPEAPAGVASGVNFMFVVVADDDGLIQKFAAAVLFNTKKAPGGGRMAFWRLCAVVFYDPAHPGDQAHAGTIPGLTKTQQMLAAAFHAITSYALVLIADDRIPAAKIETPEKINKNRVRQRKAPLPPYWSIDSSRAPGLYSTHLKAHGPSPSRTTTFGEKTGRTVVPHTRRGHWRQLSSGKKTWVRDARINDLARHMTRQRSHYSV